MDLGFLTLGPGLFLVCHLAGMGCVGGSGLLEMVLLKGKAGKHGLWNRLGGYRLSSETEGDRAGGGM